jgi:hypothetical protein
MWLKDSSKLKYTPVASPDITLLQKEKVENADRTEKKKSFLPNEGNNAFKEPCTPSSKIK